MEKYHGLRVCVQSLYETDDEEKSEMLKVLSSRFSGPSALVEIVNIDEKEGIELIKTVFLWLPLVIESAQFVFEILEGIDHFIRAIYLSARNFLFWLTNDKLSDLETELIDGNRTDLSSTLLGDLLFLVKTPIFQQCMMVASVGFDGFEFYVASLLEFDVVEADRDNNTIYLQLLEVINCLPKEKVTGALFESFLDEEIDTMASLFPLFLEGEFRWVLDRGYEYRIKLAYCFVPRVNHDRTLNIEIDRKDLLRNSMEQILSASVDDLRKGVWVIFAEEEGRGDGVLRDWLVKVSEKIVDSDGRQPFHKSGENMETDHRRIYPRKGSGLDPTYYRCCGRLFGLALIHKIQIGHTCDNVIFVQLGDQNVKLEDIKAAAPSKYQSYKDLLSLDKEGISKWNLYLPDDFVGDIGSENDRVTDKNVEKFVSHVIHIDFEGIETSSLIEGFDDIHVIHIDFEGIETSSLIEC